MNILDEPTKRYSIDGNQLILFVKKSHIFFRGSLFVLAFLFFLIPIIGLALVVAQGNGPQVGHFVRIIFLGFLGAYLLKLALCNTFGKEIIEFSENKIIYHADYHWFKSSKKEIIKTPPNSIKC